MVVLSMGAMAGWTLQEYSEVETVAANSLPIPEQCKNWTQKLPDLHYKLIRGRSLFKIK